MCGSRPVVVLNAVAICITMQSMLASNKQKERLVFSPEPKDFADACTGRRGMTDMCGMHRRIRN